MHLLFSAIGRRVSALLRPGYERTPQGQPFDELEECLDLSRVNNDDVKGFSVALSIFDLRSFLRLLVPSFLRTPQEHSSRRSTPTSYLGT